MSRDEMLTGLKQACERGDVGGILRSLEVLLEWLAAPENNTDANCRAVDRFVCLNVWDVLGDDLPAAVRELLYDVGGELHDTHGAPGIAQNFESTPAQLLARTRELLRTLG